MKRAPIFLISAVTFIMAGILALGTPAIADKPDWKGGGGKGGKHDQNEKSSHGRGRGSDDDDRGSDDKEGKGSHKKGHFEDRHHLAVREYYDHEFHSGHCPPGLEKKHNGCMPPGQAKKWGIGRPLPPDVVYYELPEALIAQLGRPPSGHRYVRVGKDILMIAIGSSMVMEAIEDLSR